LAKKAPEPEITRWSKGDSVLAEGASYIYDEEIYRFSPGSYSLYDSKRVSSKKYIKDNSESVNKDGIVFRKSVTLVGAPISWLKENKYVKISVQTQEG